MCVHHSFFGTVERASSAEGKFPECSSVPLFVVPLEPCFEEVLA